LDTVAERHFFRTLQMARWIAACAVLLYHCEQSIKTFIGGVPSWASEVLERGYLGVDFFFVLSGFIIFHNHSGDAQNLAALSRFARRRMLRIYLPYLPVAVGMAVVYAAFPWLSASVREISLAKTILLLPIAGEMALPVAWTLVHEVLFYLIFAALFYSGLLFIGIAAWATVILFYNAIDLNLGATADIALNVSNLEFVFGMVAAWLARRVPTRIWPAIVIVSLAVAGPALYLADSGPWRLLFGLSVAIGVLGLVLGEQIGRVRVHRILLDLGAASYALYLVHVPILSLLVRVCARYETDWWASMLVCAAGATAAGFGYRALVEAPLLSLRSADAATASARRAPGVLP
jgi:peptidoglycan/LPS O-acetylase OafA/YrhL